MQIDVMKEQGNVMKKMTRFLLGMLKIGCIGFGGGSALIPVIEREFVGKDKLDTKENYEKDILVASLTPGALPVELASSLGWRNFGVFGMLLGAVCMALPGVASTLLLLTVLGPLREKVGMLMELLTIAISVFIIYLIIHYIRKVCKRSREFSWMFLIRAVLVMIGVFALSCGKNLYKLLGIQGKPVLCFSTFSILLVAFVAILCINFYRGWKKTRKARNIEMPRSTKKQGRAIRTVVLVWVLFLFACSVPAFLFSVYRQSAGDFFCFLGRGCLSVVMSFGGGDAYLAVADGLFVESAMVTDNVFYGDVVSVANILPGSILGKALTAVGYYYGMSITGSHVGGLLFALSGFAASVTLSCLVFEVIYHLYDRISGFRSMQTIGHYIGPIIAGLLGTVILALLVQCKEAVLALTSVALF